ncbi:MAG TPA: flagellar filament capping protein FliD [Solirubrobacterales bacterium]
MATVSIGGLSGLDTESIIAKLMEIERVPKSRLERRQGQAKARGDALREIETKLQALSNAAGDLRSVSIWGEVQSVQSSNSNAVSARLVSGTGPGGYQLEVSQLARAEQRTFTFTESAEASSLTINGTTVELGPGATLADAVSAINGKAETGVYAVASGGQLVLSSRKTGAANTISASGAGIVEEASKLKAGLDASYSVDGVAGTSSSNILTEAIPGLELTLNAVTTAPVTVTVGNPAPNQEAIASKLKAFVTAYNATVDAIRGKLTETKVTNPSSQAEANKGVLFGDSQLNDLLSQMREFVSEAGLSTLGVSTGAPSANVSASSDSVIGHLVFEESKLQTALQTEPLTTRKVAEEFAVSFEKTLEPTIAPGGTMASRLESVSTETKQLSEQMTALLTRLEQREERLHLQFAALEAALSKSQSESAWLKSQVESLP